MLNRISVAICAILCGFTITYVATKLGKMEFKKREFIISTILMAIIIYVTHNVNYNSQVLILKLVLFIIILKLVFKLSVYKSMMVILLTIVIMIIGEIISGIILVKFLTIKQARTDWYYIAVCNTLICLIMFLIIKIQIISKKISKFIDNTEQKSKLSTIIIFTLSIFVITYLFYNISVNYNWNEKYIINIVIMISYILIMLIFFKDKIQYDVLEEKYDAIFEYFSEIAESIDDLNLTTHEYKNQIAIVENYIDNREYKKAKSYIEDISKSINKDEGLLVNLTDIPTGGLKGLLYYKIIVAKNQKVEIVLDVGNNTKKLFKELSEQEIKIITRIIGVYIDNAVSASTNKIVNIEIYNLNNNLIFAISNKVNKNFDIKKMGKKGFTTKGKGHGHGLYLTNRLIGKNKWLENENRLVNNYYVTKLIVDTKSIGK